MRTSDTVGHVAAALARAQGEFEHIGKTRSVMVRSEKGNYAFKYAPLEIILAATRPALARHELAVVQSVVVDEQGVEQLRTTLVHSSGEWMSNQVPVVISTNVKAGPQQFGSATTYARRYGYSQLLCIAADEDDDGNAAEGNALTDTSKPEPLSADQLIALRDKIAEANADEKAFAKFLDVYVLEDLPVSRFTTAMKALEKKIEKARKAAEAEALYKAADGETIGDMADAGEIPHAVGDKVKAKRGAK